MRRSSRRGGVIDFFLVAILIFRTAVPDNSSVRSWFLLLATLSLAGATLVLIVSATAWLDDRGWLWSDGDKRVHRLIITPTTLLYAHGDPWPPGAPPRRTLRQYGFVATHSNRVFYRDDVHTYIYSPGSGAKRIVEHITLVSLRNIFLLLLILPLIHAALWYRRRHLEQAKLAGLGKCAACNYDLRATTGPCPECGTLPPPDPLPKLTSWLVPDRQHSLPAAALSPQDPTNNECTSKTLSASSAPLR